MKVIKFFVLLLIILGALNWGLWGFFQYDVVADLFGGPSTGLARFFYALIGLAGVWGISFFWCRGFLCSKSDSCSTGGSMDQDKMNQDRTDQDKMDQDK